MYNLEIKDTAICIVAKNSTVIYKFDYMQLSAYFPVINEYEPENIHLSINGKYLSVVLTIANNQDGLIAVVDIDKNEIIHVQNGAYAIQTIVVGGMVISLYHVMHWGTTAFYYVNCYELGNMDISVEKKYIKLPRDIEFDDFSDKMHIEFKDNFLEIADEKVHYNLDISSIIK